MACNTRMMPYSIAASIPVLLRHNDAFGPLNATLSPGSDVKLCW
jgi:hypothetical protein